MHFLEITEQLCYTEKTQYISASFRKSIQSINIISKEGV